LNQKIDLNIKSIFYHNEYTHIQSKPKMSLSHPILISIEGNIGAGKSTLLAKLEERLAQNSTKKWVFLKEPVHIWETIKDKDGQTMLAKFYSDPQKYSFAFQIMAYTTRLNELRRVIRENPDCHGIVCERSLEADKHIFAKMLHDDGIMEDVMYDIYNRYFSEYSEDYKLDAIIYLDADPKVCFERINKRSRNGEGGISLEYLKKCHDYHHEWMLLETVMHMVDPNKRNNLVLDVNSDADYLTVEDPGSRNIERILEFIEG